MLSPIASRPLELSPTLRPRSTRTLAPPLMGVGLGHDVSDALMRIQHCWSTEIASSSGAGEEGSQPMAGLPRPRHAPHLRHRTLVLPVLNCVTTHAVRANHGLCARLRSCGGRDRDQHDVPLGHPDSVCSPARWRFGLEFTGYAAWAGNRTSPHVREEAIVYCHGQDSQIHTLVEPPSWLE